MSKVLLASLVFVLAGIVFIAGMVVQSLSEDRHQLELQAKQITDVVTFAGRRMRVLTVEHDGRKYHVFVYDTHGVHAVPLD